MAVKVTINDEKGEKKTYMIKQHNQVRNHASCYRLNKMQDKQNSMCVWSTFRPSRSTSTAKGMFPAILAKAKALTTIPYSPAVNPNVCTTNGYEYW
jgi:hypothetical protein